MKKILLIILIFICKYSYSQVKVAATGNIIPTGIYPAVNEMIFAVLFIFLAA